MAGEGFTFEHKSDGPNGWIVIMYSGLVGLALVIVAMALFALATSIGVALVTFVQYLGWATVGLAGGQFVFMSCRGGAMIIEAKGKAIAMQIEAQAKRSDAKAAEIEAATNHIALRRGKSPVPVNFTVIEDDHAR